MSTSAALEMPGSASSAQEYGATMGEPSGDALLRTGNTTSPYQDGFTSSTGHVRLPDADDEDDESSEGDEEENEMSIQELLYSSSSYHAIVKPVTLTMTLAALAVVFVNTEETWRQGEVQMQEAYTVWNVDDQDTTSGKLTTSLANTLVMVTVICAMTFVIVLCYKMRCMKFLIGYMIFASATLLGLMGGTLFEVAIEKWRIPIDAISFYLFVYNFCIVGVGAIFWSLGIPSYITQGYLICTSVILAWQLAHFDVWTIWCLLFMLACYDLCAVLTPCGPLRALVNLMSQDDAPEMPGLLYEAELPPEAQRPGVPNRRSTNAQSSAPPPPAASSPPPPPPLATVSTDTQDSQDAHAAAESVPAPSSTEETEATGTEAPQERTERTAVMPLAIARVYNLDVIALNASNANRSRRRNRPKGVSTSPLLVEEPAAATADPVEIPEHPTPKQLRADVTVRLPQRGGSIERVPNRRKRIYLERDRHGNPKRTLWVDRQGKVFAEVEDDEEEEGGGKRGNSIRLGLGDFIFYSVLVAKAAMYSFATFAACMLVILAGLGGTLVLLSVYHHALPALPISIFLAIGFYLVTRLAIQPWIEAVMMTPLYV